MLPHPPHEVIFICGALCFHVRFMSTIYNEQMEGDFGFALHAAQGQMPRVAKGVGDSLQGSMHG